MWLFYLYTGIYPSCIVEVCRSTNCFVGPLTDSVNFVFRELLAAVPDCVYLSGFHQISPLFHLTQANEKQEKHIHLPVVSRM
jgi:hypothetical protein